MADNGIFRKRYQYIVERAVQIAKKNDLKFGVISHGRSANIVANAVKSHAEIGHMAVAPVPGPWGKDEYINALKDAIAVTQICVGSEDFMPLIGYGTAYMTKIRTCLGSVSVDKDEPDTDAGSKNAGEHPKAPEEYSWQILPDVQGAILKPDGWFYSRKGNPGQVAYDCCAKQERPNRVWNIATDKYKGLDVNSSISRMKASNYA